MQAGVFEQKVGGLDAYGNPPGGSNGLAEVRRKARARHIGYVG